MKARSGAVAKADRLRGLAVALKRLERMKDMVKSCEEGTKVTWK